MNGTFAAPLTAIALTAGVFLASVSVCAAQDEHGYAGGALSASWQNAGTPPSSPDMPKPGVSGTAIAVEGTVGAFLSRRVSVAFEISEPMRFEVVQELHYTFSARYDNRHRDVMFSGLFHFHLPAAGIVRPEIVAGLSHVLEDTLQRSAYQPGFPPAGTYGPYSPDVSIVRHTYAFTGGANLSLRTGSHFAVVPQVRVHIVSRDDSFVGPSTSLFLGRYVLRAGVGLRGTF